MNKKHEWSDSDIDYLVTHYLDTDSDELSRRFGVSLSTLHIKARELGMTKTNGRGRHKWTEEEIAYLRDHFPTDTLGDIATHIGLSSPTVSRMAQSLGLKRCEGWSKSRFFHRYVQSYRCGGYNVRKVS
jgi:DNA-binding MurR/RpiR family transcriptional regulator